MELQTADGSSISFFWEGTSYPPMCNNLWLSAIYALELRKVQVDFTPVLRAVREGKQAGCHGRAQVGLGHICSVVHEPRRQSLNS